MTLKKNKFPFLVQKRRSLFFISTSMSFFTSTCYRNKKKFAMGICFLLTIGSTFSASFSPPFCPKEPGTVDQAMAIPIKNFMPSVHQNQEPHSIEVVG